MVTCGGTDDVGERGEVPSPLHVEGQMRWGQDEGEALLSSLRVEGRGGAGRGATQSARMHELTCVGLSRRIWILG